MALSSFGIFHILPLRAVDRWRGKFIDELVTPTDSLNDDRKRSRRFNLWLPNKVIR